MSRFLVASRNNIWEYIPTHTIERIEEEEDRLTIITHDGLRHTLLSPNSEGMIDPRTSSTEEILAEISGRDISDDLDFIGHQLGRIAMALINQGEVW